MKDEGFIHYRVEKEDVVQLNGGVTLKWRRKGESLVEVSSAVCSRRDNFSRPAGRFLSAVRLNSGSHMLWFYAEPGTPNFWHKMNRLAQELWSGANQFRECGTYGFTIPKENKKS